MRSVAMLVFLPFAGNRGRPLSTRWTTIRFSGFLKLAGSLDPLARGFTAAGAQDGGESGERDCDGDSGSAAATAARLDRHGRAGISRERTASAAAVRQTAIQASRAVRVEGHVHGDGRVANAVDRAELDDVLPG